MSAKTPAHVPYAHKEFPKWKYHKSEKAHIIHSEEAEKALGKEWKDSPAHTEEVAAEEEIVKEDEPKAKKGKK